MNSEPEYTTQTERAGTTEKWSDPDYMSPYDAGGEIDFPSQRPELFDCYPEDDDRIYDPWLWDCRPQ